MNDKDLRSKLEEIFSDLWFDDPYGHERKTAIDQILALMELERDKFITKIMAELITIRDIEMEGAKDLMKTRAGFNVNLLIEDLRIAKSQKGALPAQARKK